MKKSKRFIIASLIVGLSSLIYMDFYVKNFKFSFGGIVFPVILYVYDDFNPLFFGIISGFSLLLFRGVFSSLFQSVLAETLYLNAPEVVFYLIYGSMFNILKKKTNSLGENSMFIFFLISDFISNIVEIYIRIGNEILKSNGKLVKTLILVAFIRAGLVWIIILGYRYYKLLLVREEHDRRYKELLLLMSKLKTEVYWMEKNMDHIERVMENAYELFNSISNNSEIQRERWAQSALEIAKDVHEIKKEYSSVVTGIEEIVTDGLDVTGMYFSELVNILKETINREIKNQGKDILVEYYIGGDFYTKKHYYLMSVLRNLMTNAIDSIEKKGKISLIHKMENDEHIFVVIDDGSGIEDEDLPHIFSPGYSTKIDYETGQIYRGLGLTLIKNIVEVYLNGKIKVKSKFGKGTIFTIYIPAKELEEDES